MTVCKFTFALHKLHCTKKHYFQLVFYVVKYWFQYRLLYCKKYGKLYKYRYNQSEIDKYKEKNSFYSDESLKYGFNFIFNKTVTTIVDGYWIRFFPRNMLEKLIEM